jgi:uncharacterized protein (TIGR00251 family)
VSTSSGDPRAPAHWENQDLLLVLHVQPGAKRTEVAGLHGDALKVRLRARPVEGAANAALLEFLAEALQVPRRQVVLLAGDTSRTKRVRVERPHRELAERRLREWGAAP